MKTIISKIKALFSKEVKYTEEIKPAGLNGADLLAWWKTIKPHSVIIDHFSNNNYAGCVIGHYQRCMSSDPTSYSLINMVDDHSNDFSSLRGWSTKAMMKMYDQYQSVANINNGTVARYPQETPYLRVEAFFKDVVKYEKENGPIVPIG